MSPLVTIIVPNYNHAAYLDIRIKSILEQTFTDFELILMDDASTDDSLSTLHTYANHPKVSHFIVNASNSGNTFKQWNKGISMAKGEYIWLAESDDYASPDFLATALQIFRNHPDGGLAFCHSYLVDEHNNIIGDTTNWSLAGEPWQELISTAFMNGKKFCQQFLTARCSIPNASAVVFKKKYYLNAGGADESLRMTGDWKMWFSIGLQADVLFIDKFLNHFRCHSNTVRHNKAPILKQEAIHNLKKFHRQLKSEGLQGRGDLEHLFNWAFRKAIWKTKYQYSWQNFCLYLQHSSWDMVVYLFGTKLKSILAAHIRYFLQKMRT